MGCVAYCFVSRNGCAYSDSQYWHGALVGTVHASSARTDFRTTMDPPPATNAPTIAPAAPPAAPEAPPEAPPPAPPAPWSVEDDRVLVDAVEAGASLEALAELKLLEVPRTLEQLRERWHSLLFDEVVARSAAARMAEASTAAAAGPSRYLEAGAGFPVHRVLPRPDAPKTDAQEGIADALASEMLSYSDAENVIVQVRRSTSPLPRRVRPRTLPLCIRNRRRAEMLTRAASVRRRSKVARWPPHPNCSTGSRCAHVGWAIIGKALPPRLYLSPPASPDGRRFRHAPCPPAARHAKPRTHPAARLPEGDETLGGALNPGEPPCPPAADAELAQGAGGHRSARAHGGGGHEP